MSYKGITKKELETMQRNGLSFTEEQQLFWEREDYIEVDKDKEIERLNKKIEQYENPEDMTLMFMWCDEKAKDEIKRLNNIIKELEKWLEDMSNRTTLHISTITGFTMCLDKLQELKGSDKE